ncbi:accessory Sec system glycosylation chaperone GtfB [Staphylococcus pseudintermedius]|nr:accessory Sec system glycosylation chaperone GtfB [Staphylococcus pseudintermedius]EHT6206457.1 accessory Sec system glycosylation chaperone GtfB [Staphylococcus pseudintermedius]EIM5203256.1 accessory Sec system glycosylation chaperone GtfB [Staphylococcus pseudintermedius]EJD8468527.1 accessory Sec system glycosylation chaperone GtfB [Staphylococcus pseudintermedius]EJD8528972.1 accessory Sec system glycosylation chaperone GtfB [Staphylococcus pseudintermedius]
MVNLFEYFNSDTRELYETLRISGHHDETIVLVDDGFLPEGIRSPYQFFANYQVPDKQRARYFNEVPVPRYWEIEGNNDEAWVKDMSDRRAMIYFHPSEKRRLVSHVEWLNRKGQLQYVDHYNQHGFRYAQTVYDLTGNMIFRSYLDQQGNEVIYENFVASSVILTWKGEQYHFSDSIDFYTFFLKAIDVNLENIVINSLSTPFLILYQLDIPGNDILFWQETSYGEIPGNMRVILEKDTPRHCRILIPEREEYENIYAQLTDEERQFIAHSGYLYNYQSENNYTMNILTMTNSDQIENLEAIVQSCPFAQFHIGAVTEMSSKLTAFERYANVHLYQAIELDTVETVYRKCDVYLDINNGGEIINAVKKAFDFNMLILGYSDIAHNRRFTAPENLFEKEKDASALIQALKDINLKKRYFKLRLQYQQDHANETTIEAFNQIFKA